MTYQLTWVPQALRDAGLTVVECPGWQTRGHGDMGHPKMVLCHHTAEPNNHKPKPSLDILINGRPDLSGPLCNLALGQDGTFYMVAAGRAYHAGAGVWHGVVNGNSDGIGIEAKNNGLGEPWPEVQMVAYAKGAAALLKHMKQPYTMVAGHKEYALPHGRKMDPSFDMGAFRDRVKSFM